MTKIDQEILKPGDRVQSPRGTLWIVLHGEPSKEFGTAYYLKAEKTGRRMEWLQWQIESWVRVP